MRFKSVSLKALVSVVIVGGILALIKLNSYKRDNNNITATATIALPTPGPKFTIALDIAEESASSLKSKLEGFDVISGGVSKASDYISSQSKEQANVVILITDDLSDPALCQAIKTSGLNTDVVYFGQGNAAMAFFKICTILDHTHACIRYPHAAPDQERLITEVIGIIDNYGIIRVSC